MTTPDITTMEPGVEAPAGIPLGAVDIEIGPVVDAPASEGQLPLIESVAQPQSQPINDEAVHLRRRVAQMESERAAQDAQTAMATEAQRIYRDAIARGFPEEDSRWIAEQHQGVVRQFQEEQSRIRDEQQISSDKRDAAIFIARQHGVDPAMLMSGNSPNEMMDIAQREKRYLDQEVRLKAVEQGRVPAQSFATNGSQAGNAAANTQNIDQLWLNHEVQHPGTHNPYENAYRRFIQ
jgi:actin-related protein